MLRIASTHFEFMKNRRRSMDSNASEAESAESNESDDNDEAHEASLWSIDSISDAVAEVPVSEVRISGGVPSKELSAALLAATDGGQGGQGSGGQGESLAPPHIRGSVSYSLLAAALATSESPTLLIAAPRATEPPAAEPPGGAPPGSEVLIDSASAIAVRISEVKEGGTQRVCNVSDMSATCLQRVYPPRF